ncbi:hypothetical protein COLO4_23942 [Corchorus olitorius]|uniref:Leucine-rich repeat-containing N-terminal plant-type domain-containing protein n=1 Tax=Corchorus olitorius TaxID=93759 RepID=A0A1R3IE43_9ROSI|nr:hypothetical protein COLO4_23942 [Corchorus olitorius]
MEEGPPSKRCRVVLLLVFVMGGVAVEGCWEEERVGLLQLKSFFCTRSDPFINHRTRKALYNWMDVDQVQGPDHNSDCCKWEGVECDATTGRVIALHLSNRV